MRHTGIAPLGENRLVIFDHAEARDLRRDDLLEITERHRRAPVAERGANGVDDLFRSLAYGADRCDLPRVLPLARKLDEVFAAAMHDPSARGERGGNSEVEVNGHAAVERDRRLRSILPQHRVE